MYPILLTELPILDDIRELIRHIHARCIIAYVIGLFDSAADMCCERSDRKHETGPNYAGNCCLGPWHTIRWPYDIFRMIALKLVHGLRGIDDPYRTDILWRRDDIIHNFITRVSALGGTVIS